MDLLEEINQTAKTLKEQLVASYVARKKLADIQSTIKDKGYPIDEYGEVKLSLLVKPAEAKNQEKVQNPDPAILKAIKGED